MTRAPILLAALALAACGGTSYPGPVDPGGFVGTYIAATAEKTLTGQRDEIRGTCLSACAVRLRNPYSCTFDDTLFGFHGTHVMERRGSLVRYVPLPAGKFDHGRNALPSYLHAFHDAHARHVPLHQFVYLTGAQVIEMGAQRC